MRFFVANSALVFSLVYGYLTVLGIFYSFALYGWFHINIFDYVEIGDFLLIVLRNENVLVAGVALVGWFLLTGGKLVQHWNELERQRANTPPVRSRARSLVWVYFILAVGVLGPLLGLANTISETVYSIKEGYETKAVVQYRSSSGSADQVVKTKLVIIGTTQKVIFLYDEDDKQTLVIPQSQIVSIAQPTDSSSPSELLRPSF